ncbi:MAG: glycosyltransferase family 4 protein [Flavobacteriales bacterium]|nr:glycosyltransferase family 4 protein [Flavobacteriales bacterium]MCB9447575.1 glycosyltransferase family 4 protein [Flavobacteriales bacterium]
MKIAFTYLTAYKGTGGIEKFNRSFIAAIRETEPAVQLVSLHDSKDVPGDVPVHAFNGRLLPYLRKVFAILRETDVLFVGHVNLWVVILLGKFLKPRLKVVLIAHGIDVWNPMPVWKKKALVKADHILAVSSYTRQRILDIFDVAPDKVSVFHNTIGYEMRTKPTLAPAARLREKFGFSATDRVVLTVARLSSGEAYKGYDKVIAALPEVRKLIPSVRYVILGKYDEGEKQRVDALIMTHGVQDLVRLAGYVDDEVLQAYYNLSDAFVMPSLHEGFGIVFIEAMAYGLPVVAGNKDGSVDALDHGRLGTLVDPENPEEVREAICACLADPTQADMEHRLKRQHDVYETFGYDRFVENLKTILQTI